MDATEAMSVLDRAGRAEEAQKVVEKASSAAQATYRAILADETRTDDYRRDQLTHAYERVREDVRMELERMASSAVQAERRDVTKVFGTDGLPGDPASLVISRRDAMDRVANVKAAADLRDLLNRATRSGDEVLARAVAEKALEYRDADTRNQFLADRQHLDEATQRLWDAGGRHGDLRGRMGATFSLTALRPPEMSR